MPPHSSLCCSREPVQAGAAATRGQRGGLLRLLSCDSSPGRPQTPLRQWREVGPGPCPGLNSLGCGAQSPGCPGIAAHAGGSDSPPPPAPGTGPHTTGRGWSPPECQPRTCPWAACWPGTLGSCRGGQRSPSHPREEALLLLRDPGGRGRLVGPWFLPAASSGRRFLTSPSVPEPGCGCATVGLCARPRGG